MNVKKWTPAEVATLRAAWAEGKMPPDIKPLLPGRSLGAISTKATDIGLRPRVKTGAIGGQRAVSAALRVSLAAVASREPRAENAAVEAPQSYWDSLLRIDLMRMDGCLFARGPWAKMNEDDRIADLRHLEACCLAVRSRLEG